MANRGDCSCHVWSEDRPGRTTSCSSRLAALWPVGSIYSSTLYSTASIISLFANKTSYVSVQTRLSLSKQNAVHCLGTIIQTCYLVLEYFIQDVSGYICDASNHHRHLDAANQPPNVPTLLSSVHALQEQENMPRTLVLRNIIIIKSSRPKMFFFLSSHHVQITIID
jgi:hypothetical protein